MGKCIICGKRGLFIKTDSFGRCKECAEREDSEFEIYYTNLLTNLKNAQKNIDVDDNPIIALESISKIKEKIKSCDILKVEIYNTRFKKKLLQKFVDNITYYDDFNRKYGIGRLEEWDISVIANPISKEFDIANILSDIDNKIDDYRRQWIKGMQEIRTGAEFQKKIDAIPSVSLEVSNAKHGKQTVSELDELIKYSNITQKTSFDRIGNFVVLDTETTGLSSTKDNLVEVAAIKFIDWTPVEKFHTLINPGKHISEDASAINHITDDMVAEAPTFSQIVDSLSSFIGKCNIVGHNLPFDLKFLYRYGYDFTNQKRNYYDTCEIAKKTLKKPKMKWDRDFEDYVINDNYDYDVENYKLTTLCDYYGIRSNLFAHRALSDALATGILFQKLAKSKIGD